MKQYCFFIALLFSIHSALAQPNTELQKNNATKDKLFFISAHDPISPFNDYRVF